MSRTNAYHVAIMGDIIASEAAPSAIALHRSFNTVVALHNDRAGDRLLSPLTITLGDEFQGICGSFSEAFAIVSGMRRDLLDRAVQCRFVIGAFKLETPLNVDMAWNMMGPGLADTREKLDDKRNPNAYRFAMHEPPLELLLEAVGYAITMIELGWTRRQQAIILASLDDRKVKDLAKEFGVLEATIYKIRASGRFDEYQRLLGSILQALSLVDEVRGAA